MAATGTWAFTMRAAVVAIVAVVVAGFAIDGVRASFNAHAANPSTVSTSTFPP